MTSRERELVRFTVEIAHLLLGESVETVTEFVAEAVTWTAHYRAFRQGWTTHAEELERILAERLHVLATQHGLTCTIFGDDTVEFRHENRPGSSARVPE